MDAILILGAAVWQDGPSPTLRRRTAHAARLWHAGRAPLIIPCGGLGRHPPSEAAVMQQLLIDADIPASAIRPEDQSTTTLENIRNAKQLLPGPRIIIVTDHYHGRRALMVARHLQLQAELSAPKTPHIPLKQHLREALARPAYALKLRRLPRDG
ncbi:YdcF family protein [Yoonia sp. R2-816]|uniref:YdcF family protein n=1 Tax=Yoonia sp. R2-816 TaxID=3342638 RepID=UPI00372A3D45